MLFRSTYRDYVQAAKEITEVAEMDLTDEGMEGDMLSFHRDTICVNSIYYMLGDMFLMRYLDEYLAIKDKKSGLYIPIYEYATEICNTTEVKGVTEKYPLENFVQNIGK